MSIYEPELEPDGVIIVKTKKQQRSGDNWHEQFILNMENRSDSIFDQADQSLTRIISQKENDLDVNSLESLQKNKKIILSGSDLQALSDAQSIPNIKNDQSNSSVEKNYLDEQILDADLVSGTQPPVKIKMVPKDTKKRNLKGSASPLVIRICLAEPVLRKKSSSSKKLSIVTKPSNPVASPKISQVPV